MVAVVVGGSLWLEISVCVLKHGEDLLSRIANSLRGGFLHVKRKKISPTEVNNYF